MNGSSLCSKPPDSHRCFVLACQGKQTVDNPEDWRLITASDQTTESKEETIPAEDVHSRKNSAGRSSSAVCLDRKTQGGR